jgi:hypothetical protein
LLRSGDWLEGNQLFCLTGNCAAVAVTGDAVGMRFVGRLRYKAEVKRLLKLPPNVGVPALLLARTTYR